MARGSHYRILFEFYDAPSAEHKWVEDHREEIAAYSREVRDPGTRGSWNPKASWADAESDDDNDRALRALPFTGAHAKKRLRSSANQDGGEDVSASSSDPAGAGANVVGRGDTAASSGVQRAPANRAIYEANRQAFNANDARGSAVSMPRDEDVQPPTCIIVRRRVSDVTVWLGSVKHLCDDGCALVANHSVVIDCMGDHDRRPWVKTAFNGTALLELPWNHKGGRIGHCLRVLKWLRDQNLMLSGRPESIYVCCRKGERRSAAVTALVLIFEFGFTLNAANTQIMDLRPGAGLTKMPDHGYPASYPEVEGLLDTIKRGMEA
jgi:hypothetical protein